MGYYIVNLYYDEVKKSFGKKYAEHIINMFVKKDTSSFYEKVFKPKYKDDILKEYLLDKKDFNKIEHFDKGDNAIKMLYITPFAVNISLFSALLNLVSLITLLLFLILRIENNFLQNSLKGVFLSFSIIYPIYISNSQNILNQYEILYSSKIELDNNQFLSNYKYLLMWIIPTEKLCYDYLYTKFLKH